MVNLLLNWNILAKFEIVSFNLRSKHMTFFVVWNTKGDIF